MNLKAVDNTLEHLHEVQVPNRANGAGPLLPPLVAGAPKFVNDVLGKLTAGEGDDLPVSAFPVDGTFPTATAQYEKRNLALDIPVWDEKVCIQCLKCVAICPHATIRAKVYEPAALQGAPATFKSTAARGAGVQRDEIHAANRRRGLHRLRAVRGRLPGQEQNRSQAQGHQHASAGAVAAAGAGELGFLPHPARIRPAQAQGHPAPPATVHAPVVRVQRRVRGLRRNARTSRWCRSSSATAPSSPTPPAAPPFTAATCRPRLIAWTRPAAGRRGTIRSSRTTPSSASVSASRLTSKRNSRRNWSRSSRRNWATTSSPASSTPIRPTKPAFTNSANAWPP